MSKAGTVASGRAKNMSAYFRYDTDHRIFAKALDPRDSVSTAKIEGSSLYIVRDKEMFDSLVSKGMDFGSCPFLKFIKGGLDRGAVLFFLFFDRKLAHASWLSTSDEADVFDSVFKGPRDEKAGYIGPCYTEPDHRGKGCYPYILSEICAFLQKEGRGRALIATREKNHSSVRGIRKAGFAYAGDAVYLKFLLWKYCKRYEKKS